MAELRGEELLNLRVGSEGAAVAIEARELLPLARSPGAVRGARLETFSTPPRARSVPSPMVERFGAGRLRLPHGESAIVDPAKLLEYCLSPDHPRGKHKARVFVSALGLAAGDALLLRDALLQAARDGDAVEGESDGFGRRFVVDFEMRGLSGTARVRSCWILRTGEDAPRFVTSWVL